MEIKNVQSLRKSLHLEEGGERCCESHCLTGFSGSTSKRNDGQLGGLLPIKATTKRCATLSMWNIPNDRYWLLHNQAARITCWCWKDLVWRGSCDRVAFTRSGYFSHLKSPLSATILLLPKPLQQHGHQSSLFLCTCSFSTWTHFHLSPHLGLAHLCLSSSLRLGISSSGKPSVTSLFWVRGPFEV